MKSHPLARLLGCALAATAVAWSGATLAVCGWGNDELPFLVSIGGWSYSVDALGQYRLGVTKMTYAYGGTSAWISACNASSEPGRAEAVAGANKAGYLSLRAYGSDPSDRGIEVARSGTLLLHVWDPAPAIAPPAGEWVGYGRDYTSAPLQPLKGLPDGSYTLTMYLVEAANNVAVPGAFHDFPQPLVVGTPPPATSQNYEGLWWKSPAESESGWGINLAHQGDVIFATWFTYDAAGKAWWLSMTANKTAASTYAGTLVQTRGPAFSAVPFNPSAVSAAEVGTGTLTFGDASNGTFAYTVNGVSQSKAITRQVFGTLPTCTFGAETDLAKATNYQDLWWAAPAGAESGWGVNFTHQGDTIFATWFTYDVDGTPMWLSATAPRTGAGKYAGTLYRTRGPSFDAVPFLPANVTLTAVGPLTLTFADGNSATFAYTVNGVTQTKPITRQVFRTPGTVCR